MKKILKLSIVLLIICIVMTGNVFAMECNTSIESQKTGFEVNEEFKVDFCISDIKSNRGAISLQGTLEYDKDSLTLIKIEGKNGWETPTDGASYNKENGKFAIVRSGAGKNDEVILSITFKVKERAKQNLSINLKDVAIADGDGMAKFANISKAITIKNKNSDIETEKPSTNDPADEATPDTPSTNDPADEPTPDTPSTNKPADEPTPDTPSTNDPADEPTPDTPSTNKPEANKPSNNGADKDQTTLNGKLPQTGNRVNFGIIIILISAILITTYFFIKIKKR